MTVYIGKRDYYDHGDRVDMIAGVVTMAKGGDFAGCVFGSVEIAFRYVAAEIAAVCLEIHKVCQPALLRCGPANLTL